MKAATIFQPKHLEIVETPIPEPAESELLVKVMASGICGTDIHILHGEYLGDYPIIPGHEFAGIIEATGDKVTKFRAGDRVAVEPNISCDNCYNCLNNRQNFCQNWSALGVTRPGGMAEYVVVPEKSAFAIGDIPYELGAFMEPLSCVLHGVERLKPEIASRIVILGAGPIGILLLQALRLQGAVEVTMVEINPNRAIFAEKMGADRVFSNLDDLVEKDFDAVVDATGVIAVMNRTIDYVRQGGKILLFGVPPSGEKMSVEAFLIVENGLTILSSYTSLRNSTQALDLLSHEKITINGLISHKLSLAEFPKGIDMLANGKGDVKKVMILPNLE